TLAVVGAARADRRMIVWGDAPERAPLARPGFEASVQRGSDLGARLEAAFEAAFVVGQGPVVMVGADAPELEPSGLDSALGVVGVNDLVLGPTPDGGFYLVALARPIPGLFAEIPWSTEETLA